MSGGVTESPVAHAAEGIVSVGLGVGLLEEEFGPTEGVSL
jgi:hypothetical protein